MIPMSMLNSVTRSPRERMLQAVVAELTRLWAKTRSGSTWADLLEYAEVCSIPGWNDDATRVLLTLLAEGAVPKDVGDLTDRAPAAVAETLRGFGPDEQPRGTRDYRNAKTSKPPGTTDSALRQAALTGVRFGPTLDADSHTETFDADVQVGADERDVLLVTAPEQAAHPRTVWLPRPDGEVGHTFDVATAAERGTTKRVPVTFRPTLMFVGKEPVDVISVDLRFAFTPQRFVNDRTGDLVTVGGVAFETMRPFWVDVAPRTMRCGPIVDRALLTFTVDLRTLPSGTSVADVHWKFKYKIKDEFGGESRSATGRIAIRCPDGKVLGCGGKTAQYFLL